MSRSFTTLVLLVLGAMTYSVRARAQCGDPGRLADVTNTGTEFLLCFDQNDAVERFPDDRGYLEIYFASLDQPAEITVTSRAYPKLHRVINIAARSAYTYRITDDTIQYHGTSRTLDTMSNLWITSSGQPDDRVVHVLSSAPIVCYGMNHKVNTTDAFLALPRQTAGTDYRVMSYANSSLRDLGSARASEFSVAAFSDATDVTIVPAAPTSNGAPAGVPFTVRLNVGEAVQIQTDPTVPGLDLTGSVVTANVPIAVYGAHARAEVPAGFYRSDGQTSRDHLTEAMPPVTTWGTGFVMNAVEVQSDTTKAPLGDLVRVLALNPATSVRVNGAPWTTLGANRFADTLIHGPTVIQSTGPVLVAEMEHTSSSNTDRGDPFMAIVPPVDQSYDDFTFFASEDPAFTLHKIIIVTDTEALLAARPDSSSIRLDNRFDLPSQFFHYLPTTINGKAYAVTELTLAPGSHSLRTALPAERAFTILMYGIGIVDSYGYTAGTLLKPLRAITPVVDGSATPNVVRFRNALNQAVYPDSITVVLDNPGFATLGVHVKETIYDIDRMGVGVEHAAHVVTDRPFENVITGHLLFYSHTAQWTDLEPSVLPFTLRPQASLDANTHYARVSLAPNPMTTMATARIELPEPGDLSIRVFDELGRLVRTVGVLANSMGGEYTFARGEMAAGCYQLEVVSSRLGIRERRALVVQ